MPVLLLLFFAGIYLFFINSPWFSLKRIELSGDAGLSLNEVSELTPVLLGTNIFGLDAQKIENGIREDLNISRVRLMRKFPNSINIELQRKKPVFLINLDQLYGLTGEKEIIPLEGLKGRLDLPILSGVSLGRINFYQEVDIPQIRKVIEFYQAILDVDSAFLGKISELDFSFPGNLILYLFPSGLRVAMGSGDYKRRIARLMEVLEREEDLKNLSWIDLRFENQAVVKNKKSQVKEYES
jgi:cell division septal protein FtsQ